MRAYNDLWPLSGKIIKLVPLACFGHRTVQIEAAPRSGATFFFLHTWISIEIFLVPTGYVVGDLLHMLTTSAGRTTTVEQTTAAHGTTYRIFVHAVRSVRPLARSSSSSAFFPLTTTCNKQPLAYSSFPEAAPTLLAKDWLRAGWQTDK